MTMESSGNRTSILYVNPDITRAVHDRLRIDNIAAHTVLCIDVERRREVRHIDFLRSKYRHLLYFTVYGMEHQVLQTYDQEDLGFPVHQYESAEYEPLDIQA